jgi:cyclopropane-fatty-acyl-phospholipid synthase
MQAQVAKMDHVCRKLRLRTPVSSVVEAGCGWGTLALHMARNYGVRVRAFNISHEQVAYAREQAARLGLSGSVEYVEDDYRSIDGQYDAFVSVGMLEHVGREHYPELGRVVRNVRLTAEGLGLIHSIGRKSSGPLHPWIERRIFPGAYPPALERDDADLRALGAVRARCREHPPALRAHAASLAASAIEATRSSDRARCSMRHFVRMWRLYLAGSIAAFETGTLQLFQVVFTTQENNDIPLSRQYLYPA